MKADGHQANGKPACNGEQKHSSNGAAVKAARSDKINMDFDHLSVVSEECLSNSDDPANGYAGGNGADEALLSGFQSTVPPLTHFENLSYKDIGPNLGEFALTLRPFCAFLPKFANPSDSLHDTPDEGTPPPPSPPLQTDSNRCLLLFFTLLFVLRI